MIKAQQHRRGRTSRRRSKRYDVPKNQNLTHDPSVILLVQWMCGKGWKATCKLRLVTCHDTGRGLQTVNGVKTGDMLVRIPERLLITYNVALRYFGIQNLALSLLEHNLLALFVVLQNRLGNDSDWFPYCRMLPTNFSTPAFCNENELSLLPRFIKDIAVAQKNNLSDEFSKARTFWESVVSHRKISHAFLPLTLTEFKAAWFVVNTRVVYMGNPENGKFFNSFKGSNRISMALAPYLDMFNHSFEASVKAGFNTGSGSYEIHSLKSYPPRSQVFINYGPHDNLKLYAEYGFYLSGNPHDCVIFDLNEVISSLNSVYPNSLDESLKLEFLCKYNLLTDLSCTCEGLSWNMSAIIYILSIKNYCWVTCSNVFRGDWTPFESKIEKQMALHIIKCKRLKLLESYNHMLVVVKGSDSFEIAKNLLQEYISILLHAEKVHYNDS